MKDYSNYTGINNERLKEKAKLTREILDISEGKDGDILKEILEALKRIEKKLDGK